MSIFDINVRVGGAFLTSAYRALLAVAGAASAPSRGMPTRAEKAQAFHRWLVIFERTAGKRLLRDLRRRCAELEGIRVVEAGPNSAKVEWVEPKKWDGATSWFTRNLELPKAQYGLQPCGEAADGAPEPPDEPTSATSPLQSTASPSAPLRLRGARAARADSATPRAQYLQVKLMQVLHNAIDSNEQLFKKAFQVHGAEKLGSGAYGEVVVGTQRATGDKVAIKFLDSRRQDDALLEVAVHACLEPHPNIASLLDVGVTREGVALVSVRFRMDLHSYIKKERKTGWYISIAAPEMTQHILRCICEGLLHTHRNGLVHNDLKPKNVFLNLPEDADAEWENSQPKLAQWLFQLPMAMRVVIGDLGNAVPGDPDDRQRISPHDVQLKGVEQATLWYRAPESLMGCASFSYPVDVWALGCVGAELVSRAALFQGSGQIIVVHKIMQLFGKPLAGSLLELPLFPKKAPAFKPQTWPPPPLRKSPPRLAAFLLQALRMEPGERMTIPQSLQHPFLQPRKLEVIAAAVPATQGDATLAQAPMESRLLEWLQGDPALPALAACLLRRNCSERSKQCLKPAEAALNNKYEEAGYVRETAPRTLVLATMSAGEPCRARRIRRFGQALLRVNEDWLVQLSKKVRRALRGFHNPNILGQNGAELVEECFSETTFAYTTIQIMKTGARFDPKHFDGGASLLHGGVTIFGSRMLHLWFQDGATQVVHQNPGDVYVGNMCAVEHQVEHHDASSSQNLYRGEDSLPMQEVVSASDGGLLVAVMLRSDVFRHSRARKLTGKPTPVAIYDIVNSVVAEHLATQPVIIPSFADVVRHAVDEEPASASDAVAGKRFKGKRPSDGEPAAASSRPRH